MILVPVLVGVQVIDAIIFVAFRWSMHCNLPLGT